MEGALLECPRAWERLLPPGIRRAETAAELEGRDWDLLALTVGGCAAVGAQKVQCRILLLPGSWERATPAGTDGRDCDLLRPLRPGQPHPLQPDGTGPVRAAPAAPAGRRRVEPQEFLLPVLPGPAEVLLPLLGVRLLQIPLDRDPFAW